MERGSVGKARAVGLLSIIVVVSVVGLSFFEPTPSVELLQNKQYYHPLQQGLQQKQRGSQTGVENRFTLTQLQQSLHHVYAQNEIAVVKQEISDTCGFLENKCGHLSGRAKTRCGLSQVCTIQKTKQQCTAETGSSCKRILNVASSRKPCFWEASDAHCHMRPGWGDLQGSRGQIRAYNATDIPAIMRASTRQRRRANKNAMEDDDAVSRVLKSLGASITQRHHRRQYSRNRRWSVRLYNPRTQTSQYHSYNKGVIRSANHQANYQRWKANFYQPRNQLGITFSFKTGKYSNGQYPQGVYNNSYPTRKEGRINQQNGRRLSRGFTYHRIANKWKYVKYNYTRSSHDHGIPPRHGHGYPRHGRNSRRDHGHAREPWLRDRQGPGYSLKEGDEEQGPREIPFGKSDIMWTPNAQDCDGNGGDNYDYGCWEPNDPDFEFKDYDDNDPINVKVQWCNWGEEMVPCTPGFGGAYYQPGMRGKDRGIWPENSKAEPEDKKRPIEIYAGGRSDPYLWEEGRAHSEEAGAHDSSTDESNAHTDE